MKVITREVHSLKRYWLSAITLFWANHFPDESHDNLSSLTGRTKEEISAASSFLIQFYTNRIKLKPHTTGRIAEQYIMKGGIHKILVPACYQADFREFEIMIDHFDYTCQVMGEKISICPPYPKFEKAIRLGYIRTESQKFNDLLSNTFEAPTLSDLVDELLSNESFNFFERVEEFNYPRYRLKIPEEIYDYLIEHFIKPPQLFKEEMLSLASAAKEQLLEVNDLTSILIKEDLTLADFVRIRRAFLLFATIFEKGLHRRDQVKNEDVFRSLIPVFEENEFYKFIEKLIPDSDLDSFIDLLYWEPGLGVPLDLQYHPLLFFDNHFLLALSTFASSNTIRNLYASEHKRSNKFILSDGSTDPLVDYLLESLSKASISSYEQVSLGYTDIDVLAIYGDTLLIFECKHTLHPTSIFDLRTTYDHIKKAEAQLEKIINDFDNGSLLKKIEQKLGIKFTFVRQVRGVVVLSNRLFNGDLFKYPVRSIHEVHNMINIGTMKTSYGTFWLWPQKRLTPEFLLDYFTNDCQLPELLYNSLSEKTLTFEFAEPQIEFKTYYLDMEFAEVKLREFTKGLKKKND